LSWFSLFVIGTLGAPDYADLGGQLISDDRRLHHDIEDHYATEMLIDEEEIRVLQPRRHKVPAGENVVVVTLDDNEVVTLGENKVVTLDEDEYPAEGWALDEHHDASPVNPKHIHKNPGIVFDVYNSVEPEVEPEHFLDHRALHPKYRPVVKQDQDGSHQRQEEQVLQEEPALLREEKDDEYSADDNLSFRDLNPKYRPVIHQHNDQFDDLQQDKYDPNQNADRREDEASEDPNIEVDEKTENHENFENDISAMFEELDQVLQDSQYAPRINVNPEPDQQGDHEVSQVNSQQMLDRSNLAEDFDQPIHPTSGRYIPQTNPHQDGPSLPDHVQPQYYPVHAHPKVAPPMLESSNLKENFHQPISSTAGRYVPPAAAHGVRKLLRNYPTVQQVRPENPLRNSVMMKHIHRVVGTPYFQDGFGNVYQNVDPTIYGPHVRFTRSADSDEEEDEIEAQLDAKDAEIEDIMEDKKIEQDKNEVPSSKLDEKPEYVKTAKEEQNENASKQVPYDKTEIVTSTSKHGVDIVIHIGPDESKVAGTTKTTTRKEYDEANTDKSVGETESVKPVIGEQEDQAKSVTSTEVDKDVKPAVKEKEVQGKTETSSEDTGDVKHTTSEHEYQANTDTSHKDNGDVKPATREYEDQVNTETSHEDNGDVKPAATEHEDQANTETSHENNADVKPAASEHKDQVDTETGLEDTGDVKSATSKEENQVTSETSLEEEKNNDLPVVHVESLKNMINDLNMLKDTMIFPSKATRTISEESAKDLSDVNIDPKSDENKEKEADLKEGEDSMEEKVMENRSDDIEFGSDEDDHTSRDGRIVNRAGQRRNLPQGGATRVRARPIDTSFISPPSHPSPVFSGNLQTGVSRSDEIDPILVAVETACTDPHNCRPSQPKIEVNVVINEDTPSGHVAKPAVLLEEPIQDDQATESTSFLTWLTQTLFSK